MIGDHIFTFLQLGSIPLGGSNHPPKGRNGFLVAVVTHMVVGVAHPKVVTTHHAMGVFHLAKKVVQLMKIVSRKTSRSTNMPPKGPWMNHPWNP